MAKKFGFVGERCKNKAITMASDNSRRYPMLLCGVHDKSERLAHEYNINEFDNLPCHWRGLLESHLKEHREWLEETISHYQNQVKWVDNRLNELSGCST